MNFVPFIVPFAFGQMTVQHCDSVLHVGKPAFETFHRLWREGNFRDKNDCGASATERATDRLQINFRFSGTGDAVKQNRTRVLRRIERLCDFL
jgi:hypothetical protein